VDHKIDKFKHSSLTETIICCFYTVYNTLGYGFLEKVYENALTLELQTRDLPVVNQKPIKVYYGDVVVGEYFADLVVDNRVIVEIKAASAIANEHEAQLLNYLKATELEVGLLLNFGPKAEVRRKAFENPSKYPKCIGSKLLDRI